MPARWTFPLCTQCPKPPEQFPISHPGTEEVGSAQRNETVSDIVSKYSWDRAWQSQLLAHFAREPHTILIMRAREEILFFLFLSRPQDTFFSISFKHINSLLVHRVGGELAQDLIRPRLQVSQGLTLFVSFLCLLVRVKRLFWHPHLFCCVIAQDLLELSTSAPLWRAAEPSQHSNHNYTQADRTDTGAEKENKRKCSMVCVCARSHVRVCPSSVNIYTH